MSRRPSVCLGLFLVASCAPGRLAPVTAESRAVTYLAREVAGWKPKNKCFSCHNNGDAARALYAARRLGVPFDDGLLKPTSDWLVRPDAWKDNGPEGEFSDKKLAALQFASALVTISPSPPRRPVDRAAAILRPLLRRDGSWEQDSGGLPGSPITYGRTLATVMARNVLSRSSNRDDLQAAARADTWIRSRRPAGVLNAAAILFGVPEDSDARRHSLAVVRKGQTRAGGWGPFGNAPAEPFDTAVALLGLMPDRDQPEIRDMIRRGRAWLVSVQLKDGSWVETTRPPGVESYAHRISTTGWAALALLETRSITER